MLDKLLKLASYYDKTLQFDKSEEIHSIIKKMSEKTVEINEGDYIPFAKTLPAEEELDSTVPFGPKEKDRMIQETMLDKSEVAKEQSNDVHHFGQQFEKFYDRWISGDALSTCLEHLEYLGAGSFRAVYSLGDDFVLKVAKQALKGKPVSGRSMDEFTSPKEMNKYESDIKTGEFAARTFLHAPDYSWIVQEKVEVFHEPSWYFEFFPESQKVPLIAPVLFREHLRAFLFSVGAKLGLYNKDEFENDKKDLFKPTPHEKNRKQRIEYKQAIHEMFSQFMKIKHSKLAENFVRFLYKNGIQVSEVREGNVGYVEEAGRGVGEKSEGTVKRLVLSDASRNISSMQADDLEQDANDYFDFIKETVDDPIDNCFFFAAITNIEYPELKLIEGEPVDPKRGETAHFWLEDEDGNIIDPTQSQYNGEITYNKIREVDVNKNLGWVVNSPKFDDLKKSLKKKIIKLLEKQGDEFDKEMKLEAADYYTASLNKTARLLTLEPKFQAKVSAVMSELKQLGWQPRVASGRRSIKQQIGKFQKGYSVIFGAGAHYLGLAADIVDKRYGWKVKGNHKFFKDLGRIAHKNGLTWGGKWKSLYPPHGDVAHIQAPSFMIRKYSKNKKIMILQESMAGLGITVPITGKIDGPTIEAWDELARLLKIESGGIIILPELTNKTAKTGYRYAQYLTMKRDVKLTKHTKKNLKRMSLMFGKDVRHLWKDNPEMMEALKKNERVYEIQKMLKEKRLYWGRADGAWGPKTRDAWHKYRDKFPGAETSKTDSELKTLLASLKIFGWIMPNGRFYESQQFNHKEVVLENPELIELLDLKDLIDHAESTRKSSQELEDEHGAPHGEWHWYDMEQSNLDTEIVKRMYKIGALRVGEFNNTLYFEGSPQAIKSKYSYCKRFAKERGKDAEFEPRNELTNTQPNIADERTKDRKCIEEDVEWILENYDIKVRDEERGKKILKALEGYKDSLKIVYPSQFTRDQMETQLSYADDAYFINSENMGDYLGIFVLLGSNLRRASLKIFKKANMEELHNKLTPLIGRRAQSMEGSKEMLESVEKHMENEPFRIGKGAEGVAIQISPDKVLKVSINDTVGYFATQLAKSDMENKEFNVLLHEFGRLGRYYNWWILEKVEEIRSDDLNFCLMDIRRLLDDFDDERRDLIRKLEERFISFNIYRPPTWPIEMKKFVNTVAESVFTRIRKDWDIKSDLNKDWLQNLIKQSAIIYILRGGHFDLRVSNVGLRKDGNFVIFDH